jgi:hypothetical protein
MATSTTTEKFMTDEEQRIRGVIAEMLEGKGLYFEEELFLRACQKVRASCNGLTDLLQEKPFPDMDQVINSLDIVKRVDVLKQYIQLFGRILTT